MMPTDHDRSAQSPSKFREKLGVYLTGVAIGFILLGFFMYQKNRAAEAASTPGHHEPEPAP